MTFVLPRPADRPAQVPAPRGTDVLVYGGDYNPEQWPEHVWAEDVRLMREAGVNLVSVGIHAWVLLEPAEGEYDFGWLDRLLDLLHDGGIAVNLATPTVVPPAWLVHRHPEIRPVTRDGRTLEIGSRATFCPSSSAYGEAAARITEQLAKRYGEHPAVALWHVHNEYGAPVGECYCPASAAAFRTWLQARHGDLAGLNRAWGTTFWGQRYGDWAEVEPPRTSGTVNNPAQRLDFMRFCSDALLGCFRRERDILHRWAPGVPVTTNFMIANCRSLDYWRWAAEVDVVANDHYLAAEADRNHVELAMAADLTRSVAGNQPWMLMEHSTSAITWQPRNIAKRPGEMARNSMTHVARGADAVMFFQWRASRFGAEKFHSAMVPHAGTGSRVWREVVRLGADVAGLAEVRGSRVAADVAMIWDWESWWALELNWRPSADLDYRERIGAYYGRLWDAHLTVDFAHPEADLSGYSLVVVPSLYVMSEDAAANMRRYVENGGTLLVSYFSGIVDADDTVHPGGYPGALRETLGVLVEEFLPLRADESVTLDNGGQGDVWVEHLELLGAEQVRSYASGPMAGHPAVTRHELGQGAAWYVSTRLHGTDLDQVLLAACADAGVVVPAGLPAGVEVVRRVAGETTYVFAINHTDAAVQLPFSGTDLLTGTTHSAPMELGPGLVAVLRCDAP